VEEHIRHVNKDQEDKDQREPSWRLKHVVVRCTLGSIWWREESFLWRNSRWLCGLIFFFNFVLEKEGFSNRPKSCNEKINCCFLEISDRKIPHQRIAEEVIHFEQQFPSKTQSDELEDQKRTRQPRSREEHHHQLLEEHIGKHDVVEPQRCQVGVCLKRRQFDLFSKFFSPISRKIKVQTKHRKVFEQKRFDLKVHVPCNPSCCSRNLDCIHHEKHICAHFKAHDRLNKKQTCHCVTCCSSCLPCTLNSCRNTLTICVEIFASEHIWLTFFGCPFRFTRPSIFNPSTICWTSISINFIFVITDFITNIQPVPTNLNTSSRTVLRPSCTIESISHCFAIARTSILIIRSVVACFLCTHLSVAAQINAFAARASPSPRRNSKIGINTSIDTGSWGSTYRPNITFVAWMLSRTIIKTSEIKTSITFRVDYVLSVFANRGTLRKFSDYLRTRPVGFLNT